MKTLKAITLLFISALALSCTGLIEDPDWASRYCGTYDVSFTEQIIWGAGSGTISHNDVITITKISNTEVSVMGPFFTTGEANSAGLYLKGFHTADEYGSLDTTFGPAVLNGNVLTWTGNVSGQLGDPGKWFPYRCLDTFTAIKRN